MLEIFKDLLKEKGLSEAQTQQYANSFSGVAILTIIASGSAKLTKEERAQLENYLVNKELESSLALIKSKYTNEEWKTVLEEKLLPLAESYVNEVILPS